MKLGEFLSQVKVPSYDDASGTITLKHPKEGESDFDASDLAFLGILRDNPNLTFLELYKIAMNQYQFPDSSNFAYALINRLELFSRVGRFIHIDGIVTEETIDGKAKFKLDGIGLDNIEVLRAESNNPNCREEFRKYFPKP